MDRREVKAESPVQLEPRQHLLARVHAQVVAHDVDQGDRGRRLTLALLEQYKEVLLALPPSADSDHSCAAGIECSEQLESSAPSVLVLHPDRSVGARGSRGELPGTRLQ